MKEKVLLAGDVDAIKEFVFETSFLPQIRGGSQLLIDCETELKEYVRTNGREIYCDGGSFLIEISSEEIEKTKRYIEDIYLKNTHAATVTVASEQEIFQLEDPHLLNYECSRQLSGFASRIFIAAPKRESNKASYGLRVSFLSGKVRERKLMKRIAPFLEALPFGDRCDGCGKRMASKEIPLKKAGEAESKKILKVCRVCQNKHERGRSGDNETRGKFNESFSKFIESKDINIQSRQPHDLDDLVKTAKRKYLAFIYADGNNIGDLLSRANSEDDYRAISQGLSKGTKGSLFSALYSVCGPALRNDDHWPFEIINVGGDDVTLLIQAGYAWEVAIQFLENFRKTVPACIRDKLVEFPSDWQITASCGISIADKNYPIRFLQKLAEGSLKRAKRKAKEDKNKLTSAIDFLWLPNPIISENIESLSGHYHRADRSLTARPYTLDDAISLHDIAKDALVQIPSTQRHIWGEALDRGINASKNVIFYNIARQSDENKRKSQESLLSRITALITFGNTQAQDSLWAFRKEGKKFYYCTALLDVLELTELISMRKDHGKEEPIS
jgi:CRISPR-associated protein Cmr2